MERKLTQQRRNEIARALLENGSVSVSELAARYAVSGETIRKDLHLLEVQGLARRGYGGAVTSAPEQSFLEKAAIHPDAKRRIAQFAAGRVPAGARVLLDAGSTTLEVARALAGRRDLSFYTNSVQVAELLIHRNREVCLLGGSVRLTSQAIVGYWACEQLRQLQVDWAVLGASGVEGAAGPCVESMEEAQVKRAMIRAARGAMLVADASKLRCRAQVCYADWREISVLVTDARPEDEVLARVRECVRVELVREAGA